jgi:hypothetical protein
MCSSAAKTSSTSSKTRRCKAILSLLSTNLYQRSLTVVNGFKRLFGVHRFDPADGLFVKKRGKKLFSAYVLHPER